MKHPPLSAGPISQAYFPASRGFFLGAVVLVALGVVLQAWLASGLLEAPCMDGVMQTFNPLRRLGAGQTIGREFDVFHGPGTLGLQYLVWCVCGKGLRAAMFARELLAPSLLLLSIFLYARTVGFPWLSTLLLFLGAAYFHGHLGRSLSMDTDGSLLSIRVFMAVSVFFCAALLSRKVSARSWPNAFAALAGAGAGVAFFFSFEQGMAGAAAGVVALAWWPEENGAGLRARLSALAIYGATLIVTAGLLYRAACGSAAWHVIDFFLHDIPMDQFWYFGGPPNTAYANVFLSFLHGITLLSLLLLASGAGLLLLLRQRGWCRGAPAGATVSVFYVCGYAVVSQAPTLSYPAHYATTMLRAAMMVWLYLVARAWARRESFVSPMGRRLHRLAAACHTSNALRLGALALTALTIVGASLHFRHERRRAALEPGPHGRFENVELSPAWQEEMDFCAKVEPWGWRFASTYSGLIEARLGVFNPASDYIIHSLGRKRGQYVSTLREYAPDYFSTINPQYSSYESWLQGTHWDLYRWLLRDYEVVQLTQMRVFWRKIAPSDPPTLRTEPAFSPLASSGERFEITPPQDAALHLYEVRVRYRVENPWSGLPLLGRVPRYLLVRENLQSERRDSAIGFAISLPPHLREWVFPVLVRGGVVAGTRVVATQTFGSPARAILEGAEARELPLPATALPALGIPL